MSWDKNTINLSNLDAVKNVLDDLKIKYTLEAKAKVRGFGLNDGMYGEEDKYYELRRLSYRGFVILEQICRTSDCDADDTITSHKFTREDEPKDWEYEITETN
jgi:hypothetical protein